MNGTLLPLCGLAEKLSKILACYTRVKTNKKNSHFHISPFISRRLINCTNMAKIVNL